MCAVEELTDRVSQFPATCELIINGVKQIEDLVESIEKVAAACEDDRDPEQDQVSIVLAALREIRASIQFNHAMQMRKFDSLEARIERCLPPKPGSSPAALPA